MAEPLKNPVLVASIGAAHGLKGEVRVKSHTGDPLALADYNPLYATDGRAFEIASIRPSKNVVIVRLKSIATREQAEALNGTELFVDRSALPGDTGEDEYYHADLIGLDVRDGGGRSYGRIRAIHDFGSGDVLEIAGCTTMIPFTHAAVPEIDIEGGHVLVDPHAAGLSDPETGESGEREREQ